MTNVIEMMTSLYPVSDDTIQLLKDNVTLCQDILTYRRREALMPQILRSTHRLVPFPFQWYRPLNILQLPR